MKSIYSFLALCAGLVFAATACENVSEINEMYRPAGTPIVFSASSGYQNGVETKAEYSGYYYDSRTYERIDWVSGDPVEIVYNGTPSSYTVATVSGTSSEISDATLSSGSLLWDGSSSHVFYGLYPAGATGSSGTLTSAGHVTGSIPAVQDINPSKTITDQDNITKYQPDTEHYGYLVAYKQIDANSTESTVVLPFRPAVTTFEFKFQRMGGDTYPSNIQSFTLSTQAVGSDPATPLSGSFQFDITGMYQNPSGTNRGAGWNPSQVNTSSTGNSITVGFGSGGVSIPSTGCLDFSILALPKDITGATMTVTYVGGATKSLKLKTDRTKPDDDPSAWYTFTGAKKYVISNTVPGDEVWTYYIEEIPDIVTYGHDPVNDLGFTIKSYKISDRNPSVKVAVPWHIEYKQTDNTYNTTNPKSGEFRLHSGSASTGSGVDNSNYATGEPRAADIYTTNSNSTTETGTGAGIAARAKLASATPKGTSSSPWDLSTHDIHGIARPNNEPSTANTYVVSAPGYYKFPLVYGNALLDGNDNKSAYDPEAAGLWSAHGNDDWVWMTKHFRNALNKPITSPYILTDLASYGTVTKLDAAIVWQDTEEGEEIIKYGDEDLKLVGSGNNAYIQFYIAPENIHQGNILIALRGKTTGGDSHTEGVTAGGAAAYNPERDVLWSWQIWVCEKDLHPISSRNFMPVNLGWIDENTATVTKYTDRFNDYRIVQDEVSELGYNKYEDFQIIQYGDATHIAANAGGNPFYQWGRKDPITPQAGHRTSQAYVSELASAGPTYVWTYINSIPFLSQIYNEKNYHDSDYGRMIRQPWIPLADPVTNSPINGQFFPPTIFAHTYFDRGSLYNSIEIAAGQHMHIGTDDEKFREMSGIPYNLWNAGAWKSDDFSGSNKYKTVYDPCPPGYAVPTLGSFAGLTSGTVNVTAKGMDFTDGSETIFIAFSGARVFHGTPGGANDYETEHYSRRGFYWTDTPDKVQKSASYDLTTGTNNHAGGYWFYQFAKSFRFDDSGNINYSPENPSPWPATQDQTIGFDEVRANAFAIRPIVDPKYTPSSGPSPSAAMGGGSIPNVGNGGEIPSN